MKLRFSPHVRRVVFLYVLMIGLPSSALWAHAVLVRSTPRANSQIAGPTIPIELTFNSRLDASRSSLALIVPDGSSRALKLDDGVGPSVLRTTATGLIKGAYRIRWQALSNDGHITRGEIQFQVK